MSETNGTKEKTGLDSIATVVLFPAWAGARIIRGLALRVWKVTGKDENGQDIKKLSPDPAKRKIEISLPIPEGETMEELEKACQEMYGRPLQGENSMLSAAVAQASYGPDGDIRLNFADAIEKGVDLQTDDFLQAQVAEFETALREGPKVRESKARETKAKAQKVDQSEKETGFTFDQQQLIFKEALARKKPMPAVINELRKEGLLPPLNEA